MRSVPFIKQPNDYTCGPTAMQMALVGLGLQISLDEITSVCGTNAREGTSNRNLVLAAEKFGLKATERTGASVENLVKLAKMDGVALVGSLFLDEEAKGHISVVRSIFEDRGRLMAVFHDPSLGELVMTADDFAERWRSEHDPDEGWSLLLE